MPAAPPIRFFANHDGGRVAFSAHGAGPPLVCVAWWVSHIEADWDHPGYRRFFDALAAHHTVIRYDRPGVGLSDRDRGAVDLAAEVSTLSALVDHLELPRVALFGLSCAGPPSVSYAARHPERVSHLLLFGSYLRGGEICAPGVQGMLQQLVRESWGIGSRAITDLFAPNLSAEERRALSRAHRLAASPEMSARLLALTFEMEVHLEAPTVETPALVLHRKGDRSIPFRAGRALAAALPCATFLPLEGDAHIPWYGDCAATSDAILAFLGQAAVAAAAAPSSARRELCREGSLWRVSFGGSQTHVPHARGLADLAVLLANPDQEVHVGTLWSGASTLAELGGGHDAALDDRALAAYRQRLRALEAGLQEAETKQQSERVEALRAERDMLARELRAAVGLGGRKRGLNDVSERARKAVGARIRASLKKIALVHPQLGEHLNARISTGSFCRYEADSEQPWTVESSSLARIEQRR